MNNLAIIPARSGSKGIPHKNIRNLCGRPLLSYTIEAAVSSGEFSHVMVSTDSQEYADIARQYGAEVPFLRSGDTAADTSSSWDVVREVLGKYQEMGKVFDTFALLQPTSPLRAAEDIQKAYQSFEEKRALAVVSVSEMRHSPLWSATLPQDLSMAGFLPQQACRPRQKLEAYYRINGAIYLVSCRAFAENPNIYREGCFAYIMSDESGIDIDTEWDFKLAELLLQEKNSGK